MFVQLVIFLMFVLFWYMCFQIPIMIQATPPGDYAKDSQMRLVEGRRFDGLPSVCDTQVSKSVKVAQSKTQLRCEIKDYDI